MTAQQPTASEQTSWGRRILALCVDWFVSTLIVFGVIGIGGWSDDNLSGFYTLGVFLLESTVLTVLSGGSFGKLATRLRVVSADGSGRPPNPLKIFVRQVLVCLVIPPLVFRPDGRGLHDLIAGTETVALRPTA